MAVTGRQIKLWRAKVDNKEIFDHEQKARQGRGVFTQSRMNTFLECERKEFYAYQVGGVGVCPAVTADYYIEGSLDTMLCTVV